MREAAGTEGRGDQKRVASTGRALARYEVRSLRPWTLKGNSVQHPVGRRPPLAGGTPKE